VSYDLAEPPGRTPDPQVPEATAGGPRRRIGPWVARLLLIALGLAHGAAIWTSLGGWEGLTSPWPIARDDHPMHFHNAWVARHFLARTGFTSGYDPSFMAGYASGIVSDPSNTPADLVVSAIGSSRPAFAYKLYVLMAASALPWLLAWAVVLRGGSAGAAAAAVALQIVYVWTDFPITYAALGMLAHLLVVPLGLVALALAIGFVERGGFGRWIAGALGLSALVMVHPLAMTVAGPAFLLAYPAAVVADRWRAPGERFPRGRHLAVLAWVVPVVGLNSFWWWPAVTLAATRGPVEPLFAHPESVIGRLGEIFTAAPPIEAVLIGLGLFGLSAMARRDAAGALMVGGYALAGFAWGYLAGWSRALDFLQPGRHTYAFYTGMAVAAGIGWGELAGRLGSRLAPWLAIGLVVVGVRLFGPSLDASVRVLVIGPSPLLSSRPSPKLRWLVGAVREHVKPGERLLYEEGGKPAPGAPDVYAGHRYGGLLPYLAGVEVIGGPFLYVPVAANFTQFGEGKLYGQDGWDREHFDRYARLYRPEAIACFSDRARAFCEANPDRIEIRERRRFEDGSTLLVGRVLGFEGDAVEGEASVEAEPGRLVVTPGSAAGVDDRIVLRYHSIPGLRSDPPTALEGVRLEGDPVPFLGLRGAEPGRPVTIEFDPLRRP